MDSSYSSIEDTSTKQKKKDELYKKLDEMKKTIDTYKSTQMQYGPSKKK